MSSDLTQLQGFLNYIISTIGYKIVFTGEQKDIDQDLLLQTKIETVFIRGLFIEKLIEIETEIEDIILNDKFGQYPNRVEERNTYSQHKLRKKGTCENKFIDKGASVIIISSKYLNSDEKESLDSLLSKVEEYRDLFAHREIKFSAETESTLYLSSKNKERSFKIDVSFLKERFDEIKRIIDILNKIKRLQTSIK